MTAPTNNLPGASVTPEQTTPLPQSTRPKSEASGEPLHHRYGPSVLNYVAVCPGYTPRGGTNAAAEDGTRLHEIMARVVRLAFPNQGWRSTARAALSSILEIDPVTEQEEVCLEVCCDELDKWPVRVEVLGERKVYTRHPDGSILNFGTLDVLNFVHERAAILFDWKFGWIPVPPAADNWQGKSYAVSCFQEFPRLDKIGVVFVQPKLGRVTHFTYHRKDLHLLYSQIANVIHNAKQAAQELNPGSQCHYCAQAGACTALLNQGTKALAIHESLDIPQFSGLTVNTPEEAARALFVLDRLELLVKHAQDLKAKAKEFARTSPGGCISAPLPDGRIVTVELKHKKTDRSANSPGLIAEALKETLSPEQVLAACDPSITALERIFADALCKKQSDEAEAIIAKAEKEAQLVAGSDPTKAAQLRKQAKADAKAVRVSRKTAMEMLNATLEAEGLVTRPEGRVEYLKLHVEKPVKPQITLENHAS